MVDALAAMAAANTMIHHKLTGSEVVSASLTVRRQAPHVIPCCMFACTVSPLLLVALTQECAGSTQSTDSSISDDANPLNFAAAYYWVTAGPATATRGKRPRLRVSVRFACRCVGYAGWRASVVLVGCSPQQRQRYSRCSRCGSIDTRTC